MHEHLHVRIDERNEYGMAWFEPSCVVGAAFNLNHYYDLQGCVIQPHLTCEICREKLKHEGARAGSDLDNPYDLFKGVEA